MNLKILAGVVMVSFVILATLLAGCMSYAPSGPDASLTRVSSDQISDLAVENTATITGPHGDLDVTVRAFDTTTGKILIEEKNTGTETFQYEPKIWLLDADGGNYTTIYCKADVCPDYVFITTLPPQGTQKREYDSLFETFRVPEKERHGNMTLYWSDYGQTASWILSENS